MSDEFTDIYGNIPERIELNDEDWDYFISVLKSPPKANEKLKKLLRGDYGTD